MTIPSSRDFVRKGARTACLIVAVSLLPVVGAEAISTGITGNSGKQGSNCADCHSGGVAPIVRLDGPDTVYTDVLAIFRFVVQSQSPRQQFAGFNVAAENGSLGPIAGEGAQLEIDELTHTAPKAAVLDETSWVFTWRAPRVGGDRTIFAAGLSANGTGTRSGDAMALLQHRVEVLAGPRPGDANCDGVLTAADLTGIAGDIGAGPSECGFADADCDGEIDAPDVEVLLALLFDSRPPTQCEEAPGAGIVR
jgi:hypothetical protein